MSPTTLYREGTDLDDLLAELDTRYPGQVRVVEVTHPREGGVLGFFAKQRVGVHYRIVDGAETAVGTAGFDRDAAPSAALPTPPRTPAYDAAPRATPPRTPAYDAAAVAGSAAPVRSGVLQDGFGPDPEAIRAALARRTSTPAAAPIAPASPASAPTSPASPAGRFATSPAATMAAEMAAAGPAASDVPAAPGMAFAQILADIALKKAAAGTVPTELASSAPRPVIRPTTPRTVPEAAAEEPSRITRSAPTAGIPTAGIPAAGIPTPSTIVSAAAETFAAMDFAALTPVSMAATTLDTAPAAAVTRAAAAVPAPAPPAAATPAAATPAITLRRRAPRAVPQLQEQPTETIQATTTAADSAPDPRPGTLSWPLAAGGDRLTASATGRAHGATAVLERPQAQHATVAPEGISLRGASYPVTEEHATTSHSTPLSLRRKLLEVGVPVDRVPTDAVHVYAAIEDLVGGLAPAPALPGPGEILVIAGPARDAVAAADSVIAGNPGVFEATWTYRCPAALSTRRVSTTTHAITTATQASEIATAARESADGPTLVLIATDRTTAGDGAPEVLDAVGAHAVWAAIDATRKPADTRRALRGLPDPDAIVVTNAERSTSPATVWELGLPIALVDGRPSTGPTWAVLLLGKLSELEESGCSAALC